MEKLSHHLFNRSEEEWAENLNLFYARFEKPDHIPDMPGTSTTIIPVTQEEVCKVLSSVYFNKAVGPDGITPMLLKHLAYDLAPICTILFTKSLEQCSLYHALVRNPHQLCSDCLSETDGSKELSQFSSYRDAALTYQ